MKYYFRRILLVVGGVSFCALVGMALHVTYDPAPAAWWELYYVTLPSLGTLLFCATGLLLTPGYNRQSRSDYSHETIILDAEGVYAGRIRRAFDWLVEPKVQVTVTIRDWTPCQDCMAEVMYEMRTRLGVKRLLVNFSKGTVSAVKSDPTREFIFEDDNFAALADALDKALSGCRNKVHRRHLKAV